MAFLDISDVGNYGLSKGAPYHELPPGMWTAMKNMRCSNMGVEKVKGHTQIFGALTAGANPMFVMPTVDQDGLAFWIYASQNKIYATNGSTHANITSASVTLSASLDIGWVGGNLNGIPFLNNGVDVPYYWPDWDLATPAYVTAIPGFSAVYNKARSVRPYLNFLIAMDVTEGGTRYPYLVAWSDAAETGSLPTDWAYTSTTNKAGQYPLAGAGGVVVDGSTMQNVFFIYKESATYAMRFVGGIAVFDFKQLSGESGVLARNCIANFRQQHCVLTQGDLVLNNGNLVESILDQTEKTRRLKTWFFNQIDSTNFARSFVTTNFRQNEIWACIPEAGKQFPSLALVWNYKENTFGVRDLIDTLTSGNIQGLPHMDYGVVVEDGPEVWNNANYTWQASTELWDVAAYNPTVIKSVIAGFGESGVTDGQLYVVDSAASFNGTTYEAYVERTGLAIVGQRNDGGFNVDVTRNKFVRAVYPRIEVISGNGLIDVYVGSQQYVDGAVTWEGPYQFDPETDEKVNCTVNGRFIAIKFATQSSSTLIWVLKGYSLDVELGGVW